MKRIEVIDADKEAGWFFPMVVKPHSQDIKMLICWMHLELTRPIHELKAKNRSIIQVDKLVEVGQLVIESSDFEKEHLCWKRSTFQRWLPTKNPKPTMSQESLVFVALAGTCSHREGAGSLESWTGGLAAWFPFCWRTWVDIEVHPMNPRIPTHFQHLRNSSLFWEHQDSSAVGYRRWTHICPEISSDSQAKDQEVDDIKGQMVSQGGLKCLTSNLLKVFGFKIFVVKRTFFWFSNNVREVSQSIRNYMIYGLLSMYLFVVSLWCSSWLGPVLHGRRLLRCTGRADCSRSEGDQELEVWFGRD